MARASADVASTARALALGVALGAALGALAARVVVARARRDARADDDARKDALIEKLGLVPHPEGGFFVETYRAGAAPMSSRGKTAFDDDRPRAEDVATTTRRKDAMDDGARNRATSIYYMLTRESARQWWAVNDSDHVHYHHGGGAVTYHLVAPDGTHAKRTLGADVERGETPQLVVEGGTYKAATLDPDAAYALIGESVSPGFDFRDFAFVDGAALRARNAACYDDAHRCVKPSPEDTFDHYYAASAGDGEDFYTPTRAGEDADAA